MNMQRLEYFIAVADLLSFTKASGKYHIAQTAISRHIALMEEELGTPLFLRNNRKVALTPAGQLFLPRAKEIIETYQEALKEVRNFAKSNPRNIHFGFGDYERPLAVKMIRNFHKQYPDIAIELSKHPYSLLISLLQSEDLDIIVSPKHTIDGIVNIKSLPVFPNESVVIAAIDNPISRQNTLSRGMISELTFVFQAEENSVYNPSSLMEQFEQQFGVSPKEDIYVKTLDTKIALVESTNYVALVPRAIQDSLPRTLRVLEMVPAPDLSSPFCISRLSGNQNENVNLFFDFMFKMNCSEYSLR